jgi:hypothetical protein
MLEDEYEDQNGEFVFLSEDSSSSGYQEPEPDSEETWIEWFCKRRGHEFMCEVDKEYFEPFNIEDLKPEFTQFEKALNLILDYEPHAGGGKGNFSSEEELENIDLEAKKVAKEEAVKLYELVHQRYI